jgi:hypothetical protein
LNQQYHHEQNLALASVLPGRNSARDFGGLGETRPACAWQWQDHVYSRKFAPLCLFMDTVRFAKVIESCGKPDTHLLLIDPAKDKILQAAIKSHRVMTVYQGSGSTKTDYGTIGFEEGGSRQFLLFPKSLKPFADKRVIGIKYDLLDSAPDLKEDRPSKPVADRPAKAATVKTADRMPDKAPKVTPKPQAKKKETAPRVAAQKAEPVEKALPDKLVQFPKPGTTPKVPDRSDELEQLKRQVREAMDLLEQGKQVAAFNLLKRIVEE